MHMAAGLEDIGIEEIREVTRDIQANAYNQEFV